MRLAPLLLAAVAACGAADHPRDPADDPVPPVRLAAARGSTLRILHVTRNGLVVDRTVVTPAPISDIVWANGELAVWLDRRDVPIPDASPAGPHADEMGRITAAGYTPFPALDWPAGSAAHDAEEMHFDPPRWGLFAHGGEVWEGRCEWGTMADGGSCLDWTYARRIPEPVRFSTTLIAERSGYVLAGAVAPPRDIAVAVAPTTEAGPSVLRCSRGGRTTQYPAVVDGTTALQGISAVTWLAASPPVFVASVEYGGMMATVEPVIFEGCTESTRFGNATPGPSGVVALSGKQLAVWWRGKLLGAPVDGADVLAFAP